MVCQIDWCNGKYHGRGFCRPHYMAWKKHGDPLIKNKEAKGHWINEQCAFISCCLPVKCKGLCRMHYQQYRRRIAKDGK